jgi:hypothetical protein
VPGHMPSFQMWCKQAQPNRERGQSEFLIALFTVATCFPSPVGNFVEKRCTEATIDDVTRQLTSWNYGSKS